MEELSQVQTPTAEAQAPIEATVPEAQLSQKLPNVMFVPPVLLGQSSQTLLGLATIKDFKLRFVSEYLAIDAQQYHQTADILALWSLGIGGGLGIYKVAIEAVRARKSRREPGSFSQKADQPVQ